MKNKLQIAVGIIVLGIVVGGYSLYDFMTGELVSLTRQRETKERELTTLQSEYAQLQSFVANIQRIKEEFKELNLQLQAALEYMPRNYNLSSLLRKMTMVADNSGIELLNFRPSKDTSSNRDPNQFYSAIQVSFDLKGSFTQTMVFFDQLSRLKRIVNIESIRMSVSRENASNRAILADSTVSIKTYRSSE